MEPAICPLCKNTIKLIQINLTEAFHMCPNTKCVYPIGCPNVEMKFIPRSYKDTVERSNTQQVAPAKNYDIITNLDCDIDELIINTLHATSETVDYLDSEEFLENFDKLTQ